MDEMDGALLKRRIEALTEQVVAMWNKFGPDVSPTLHACYGRYIVTVGVEFAKEED